MRERPRSSRPRRLADWLNPTGEKKVHSLVDKVYQKKNLALAWEKVKRNRGAGGVDGQTLAGFEEALEENLSRLHEKLLTLVNQRVSDGRVLGLIRGMLKSGVISSGRRIPTEQGTPQGGVISPLLSNVYGAHLN